MHSYTINLRAFEPQYITITIESPDALSETEVEDEAIKQFEQKFPALIDPIIENVVENPQ